MWEYLVLPATWVWGRPVNVNGQATTANGWLLELVGHDPIIGLAEMCNAVAADGWELVSAVPLLGDTALSTNAFTATRTPGRTSDTITLFFKRPRSG